MKTSTIQENKNDSFCVPLLHKLGVGLPVQRFFLPSFYYDTTGRMVFPYTGDFQFEDFEVFGFNTDKLCVTSNTWFVGDKITTQQVFLFFSAMEAVAFAHFNGFKFNSFERSLFISLGVRPVKEQLFGLRSKFPKARFYTVFGNEFLSRVYDCKISMWLINKDCKFSVNKNCVSIEAQGSIEKLVEIPRETFSYFSFCRAFGHRPTLKTIKPSNPNTYTFLEKLKASSLF